MTTYSVKDLRESLKGKVLELGVDPMFSINPSFDAVIDRFDSYIADMTLGSDAEHVNVRQEGTKLEFEWTNADGKDYKYIIVCQNPDNLICRSTEYSFSHFDDKLKRDVYCKIAMEQIAEYTRELGVTTMQENGSVIYNNRPQLNECSNNTWTSISAYTKEGIMYEQEYKSFEGSTLTGLIEDASISSMLFIPREGSRANNFFSDKYDQRTLLRRVKFDIARVMHVEPKRRIKYCAEVQLDTEHGLRDMRLINNNTDPYPREVKIEPMSRGEIEELLSKEDPGVASALRPFAEGRENYSYDSLLDSHYLYEFPVRR